MLSTRSSLPNGLGLPRAKLPTIEHPSSRLGDKLALHVRGDSRMGHNIALAGIARPRREKTEPILTTIHSLPNLPKLKENQPWTGGRSLAREDGEIHSYYPRMSIHSADNYILNISRQKPGSKVELGAFELSETIRDKLRTGLHGIKQLFKSNDPTAQGTVTREGLMKVLFNLCGYITADQYNDLLNRLGLDGKPSVSFEQFVSCFQDIQPQQTQWLHAVTKKELEDTGQLRPHTALSQFSDRRSSRSREPQTPNHSPERNITPESDEFRAPRDDESKTKMAKPFRMIKKSPPKLEKISDCLHFRFEEPYNALKLGFEAFDYLKDGFISRMDFRTVLQQFGFPCQAIDIEQFLAKCALKVLQGLVNYNDFMNRFWNRSETGIVNRIVTNQFHVYNKEQGVQKVAGEYLNAEEMEAAMVDFFHGDFLALLGIIKMRDKDQKGVINPNELRNAINKVLNTAMSESQWQALQDHIGTTKEGFILYGPFLESFNAPPGKWNKKMHNGMSVTMVKQNEVPGEVEELRDRAQELKENVIVEPPGRQDLRKHVLVGRPAHQLESMAHEVFMNKLFVFDKAFKTLDRKMTGMFNKDQFRHLLKECGVELTLVEVDTLAKSMGMAQEGMFSYSAVLRHFVKAESPTFAAAVIPSAAKQPEASKDTISQGMETTDPKLVTQNVTTKRKIPTDPLEKVRQDVVNRWDAIKSVLRTTDKAGTSLITTHEMKEIMEMFNFNISEEEKNAIISNFMVSPGSVNYIQFLQHFSRKSDEIAAPQQEILSRQTQSETRSSKKPPWQRKITQDWKNIRRAFRKADTTNQGDIAITDFQNVLKTCGVEMPDETLYNILCQHDPHLKGTVNYETFLNYCLTAF